MLNFCTLFDSNYFSRGMAMYRSLRAHCREEFSLYIFAFDDLTFTALSELKLPNVTVISLREFEDPELLQVKPSRTAGEYCWTCTPSVILYVLEKHKANHCTYLDADLYFYSDPKVLLNEMGEDSVLITPHRYTPKYDQSATSGIYCVQFITFKNDERGLKVLKWWREACLEWCYSRFEDGKFGDQKYLDDWPRRFEGIHVLEHPGGGVAPWNVQQYKPRRERNELLIQEIKNGRNCRVVFYHFHYLKFIGKFVEFGSYELSREALSIFYEPYVRELESIKNSLSLSFDPHGISVKKQSWKSPLRKIKRLMNGTYNVFDKSVFLNEWHIS